MHSFDQAPIAKPQPKIRYGVAAGIIAAKTAVLGMLAVGVTTGQLTLAEAIAEGIAGITPIAVIDFMVTNFGSAAKQSLFAATLIGEIIAGAAFGAIAVSRRWSPADVMRAVLAVVLGVGIIVLPALGTGVFGTASRGGGSAVPLSFAVTAGLFAFTYLLATGGFLKLLAGVRTDGPARRAFLQRSALTVGGLALGGGLIRWALDVLTPGLRAATPSNAPQTADDERLLQALTDGVPGLQPELTPNDRFYVVSKNVFRDPDVDAQRWRLQIGGLVERPTTISYQELRRLPSFNQYFTLQCISNEIGGELIGNADWRGVAFGDLLRRAGVRSNAVDVVIKSEDGYTDSIPIEKALQQDTMLAYEMNGETLPKNHGYPARLLVPDIYGMKNVKWVTEIEVVDHDYKGYWMVRGWSDIAIMNTTSRIDAPRNGAAFRTGPNFIGGVAVAGQRGIQRVEVSVDDGLTWAPATVKPGLGPNSWVLWLYEWNVPSAGPDARIVVRATDGTGAIQESAMRPTLPNGATGYHGITVRRG
jgi:DMSO/TMAO reductase YedYZ molybdopterin-dependent catalytic subunit